MAPFLVEGGGGGRGVTEGDTERAKLAGSSEGRSAQSGEGAEEEHGGDSGGGEGGEVELSAACGHFGEERVAKSRLRFQPHVKKS